MLNENAELYYQQILDTIDSGHIEYSKDKVEINVGNLIGNSKLNSFYLCIVKSEDSSIKLYKKANVWHLTINTDTIPDRHEIDTFLAKNKDVLDAFHKSIARLPKINDASSEPDNYITANSKKGFEDNYQKLTAALDSEMKIFKAALKDLTNELEETATAARKSVISSAIDKLKKKTGMEDSKSFAKHALKLPEAKFAQDLEKDSKKKLISRLMSYFDSNQ